MPTVERSRECVFYLAQVFENENIPAHVRQDIGMLLLHLLYPENLVEHATYFEDLECVFVPASRLTLGDSLEMECFWVSELQAAPSASSGKPQAPSTADCRAQTTSTPSSGTPVWYTAYVDKRYFDKRGYQGIGSTASYLSHVLTVGNSGVSTYWGWPGPHVSQPVAPNCLAYVSHVPVEPFTCGGTTYALGGMIRTGADMDGLMCLENLIAGFGGSTPQQQGMSVGQFLLAFGWGKIDGDANGKEVGDIDSRSRGVTRAWAYIHQWQSSEFGMHLLARHEVGHVFKSRDETACPTTSGHKWYHVNSFTTSLGRPPSCQHWYWHFHPQWAPADTTEINDAYQGWWSNY